MQLRCIVALLSLLLLASCAGKTPTGETGGPAAAAAASAAAGTKVGPAIGHNVEATLTGAVATTSVGAIVGKEMDKYDREQLNHNYERGISRQRSSWVNPDTGNQYGVTPESAYQNPTTQQICRKAEIAALIRGKLEKTNPTACRETDGHWEIQP